MYMCTFRQFVTLKWPPLTLLQWQISRLFIILSCSCHAPPEGATTCALTQPPLTLATFNGSVKYALLSKSSVTLFPALQKDLLSLWSEQTIVGDLAPSLGGRNKILQTKISEWRFFRKKFQFLSPKILMTFFSHRPCF